MGTGIIDPEYGVREGWVRDQDNEVSFDGYNAFIAITTNDGTSGFQTLNSDGAITFEAKSSGDGYIARKLGVGTYNPTTQLEVVGTAKTEKLQVTVGAVDGYVLSSDAIGLATWKPLGSVYGFLTPQEHRGLDQLVHLIAENSFEEVSYSGSRIDSMIIWADSGKTKKIREEQYTYGAGNQASVVVIKQYDTSGIIAETLTENYTWSGGKVINITRTLT